jgi:hypothetical protein
MIRLKIPHRLNRNKGVSLVILILVITVINNYFEINHIMSGGVADLTKIHSPIIIKALKDLLFLFLALTAIFLSAFKSRPIFTIESALVLLTITILFTISIYYNGIVIALGGLRWASPIILFLLLRPFRNIINFRSCAMVLSYFLIVNLFFQLWQLYSMPPIYGEIYPGISARVPGIFFIPNTTAFFASLCMAMSISFETSRKILIATIFSATMSCLLAQSGTGVMVVVVLLLYKAKLKFGLIVPLIALIIVPLLFINLDILLGRVDYLSLSGGARVDIFFRIVGNSIDLDKFGIYTNVGNLWASHLGGVIDNGGAIDSYYASFIGNMGPMSVIVVPLIMFYILRDVGREWRGLMPLLIVYGLFSFTTIVSEAYPMNIIFPLVLSSYAYLCRARRRRYTSANESDGVVYGS